MTADARDHGFASGQVGDRGCEVLAEGAFEVEFDDESDHAHALFDPRRSPLGPPFVTARGGEIGWPTAGLESFAGSSYFTCRFMTCPSHYTVAPRTIHERRTRVGISGVTAALFLASTGCDGGGADSTAPSLAIRDSAGVEIVVNESSGWTKEDGWRLSETPELDIGVPEGDSVYQLYGVSGATRLADDGVAVALAGSSQIRFYGPNGLHRRSVGRAGEGPGEFVQLTAIWPFRGDSLMAWDAALRRVTFMDATGSVARQAVLQANPSNPSVLRPLADGRIVLVDHRFSFADAGVQDQVMELTLHAPTGELEDSVGSFPFARMGPLGAGSISRVGSAIFAPRTDIAAAAQTLVLGAGSAAEVAKYEPGGRLTRITRWPDADRTVERADVDLYREERVAAIDDENRRRVERTYLAAVPYERTFPVYDRVLPAGDGGVWLRVFRRPGEVGPREWLVVAADGRLLGRIAIPSRLWPFEVGTDYVLGLEPDDLDVEHVRLYRVLKE